MLKRWQQLAEPSLSSCLQKIPGVYTRAEILHEVKEADETTTDDDEEDLFTQKHQSESISNDSE